MSIKVLECCQNAQVARVFYRLRETDFCILCCISEPVSHVPVSNVGAATVVAVIHPFPDSVQQTQATVETAVNGYIYCQCLLWFETVGRTIQRCNAPAVFFTNFSCCQNKFFFVFANETESVFALWSLLVKRSPWSVWWQRMLGALSLSLWFPVFHNSRFVVVTENIWRQSRLRHISQKNFTLCVFCIKCQLLLEGQTFHVEDVGPVMDSHLWRSDF